MILIAGIYLASNEHQWKHFYVSGGSPRCSSSAHSRGAVLRPLTRS